MKKIRLTQGQFAFVDNEDYDWANQWKWYAQKHRSTFYARRYIRSSGKKEMLNMARLLMSLHKGDKRQVDHINGNTLDNRRANLRICTNSENAQNRSHGWGKSKYKGICYKSDHKKWVVNIKKNGKNYFLGYFDSELVAGRIYDEKAIWLFGEYANLNFKEKP